MRNSNQYHTTQPVNVLITATKMHNTVVYRRKNALTVNV